MSKLLMNLRRVPDEERDEVCELLEEHGIEHYLTPPSVWGVSAGGLWLRHDKDWERAQPLLADYQQRRYQQERRAFEQAHQDGEVTTVARNLRRHPLRTLAFLVAVAAVLLIALVPFITFG
ncbi:DUF6164 family protein [Alloalcanivorax marinus]|uniref:DUF6164 family protein n=1 Tax=Alloalcanivorax marinus TaxID=1177169 RepID=UPI001933FCA1|nr:DUF6164 family protein [Alloalcanivorax marinus]MBL7250282.1 hypothetical protein [Alloalcanivorax marinus]